MKSFTVVDVESQRRYPVSQRLTIGRAAHNDLVMQDRMVSNVHAEICRTDDGGIEVHDLESRHGIYVGNKRVASARLDDADELLIGPVRLRIEATVEGADFEEVRRLRAMFELSRAIGVEHDLNRILDRILQTCFQLLRADRGMIITYLPGSKSPCATVSRTREGEATNDTLSISVLSQVMATREPYVRTSVDSDSVLQRSQSLALHGVRSLIAVPLSYEADAEWLGVIHLDSRADHNMFGQKDLDLLAAIAAQASLAIKNAMLVRQMQSVRSSEWQRLDRVVSSLPVGVLVIDDKQHCVLANHWILQRPALLGDIRSGELLPAIAGVPLPRLIGDRRREQVRVGTPEATLILEAQTSDDGRETVIVVTDITAERDQQTKASHQDRLALVGQLAGGIAHDFNNLLCVIQNCADLIEESAETIPQRDDARTIQQASKSAGDLVRQLLLFSRREDVKPVAVDVAAHIDEREKFLRQAIGVGVELVIERKPGPTHVLIDPGQLEQVLMNLAVNARDAMNGQGRLTLSIEPGNDVVTLCVSDNGSGMPPEVAARIFEPYFTTKARGKGTGLGLATVHGIIEHAKGTIAIRTQSGVGTTFVLTFPQTTLAPEQSASTAVDASKGRVLVVDDDDQVRRVAQRILAAVGYEVLAASSAEEAIVKVRGEVVDLVLSDVVMPGMSGRELAHALGSEFPGLPVVLMSGYTGQPEPTRQTAFVAKPFDRATLLAAIEGSLAQS